MLLMYAAFDLSENIAEKSSVQCTTMMELRIAIACGEGLGFRV
jgi:hypothetical protein